MRLIWAITLPAGVGRLVELENLSQHNLVPVEDDGGSRQKNVMLNTHGISWFIFRGGWRGGRLDICKMGYRFVRASGYLIHYSIATAT